MKNINRRSFIKRVALALIGFVFIDSIWFEKYIIEWNYFDISKSESDKLKIVQITDLHIDELRSFHKSIAKKINSIQPDFVFFTGDSVETTATIAVLSDFLQLIDFSIKKYAILGNWEHSGNIAIQQLKKVYANHNCKLLINENSLATIHNRKVAIIGIDDYLRGKPNLNKAIANLPKVDTTIVLSHCPGYRDTLQNSNFPIDLVLSGHTHGGQITFLGFAPIKPNGSGAYLKGWYNDSEPKMYVSKGIGTSTIPLRFGARAEVMVLAI